MINNASERTTDVLIIGAGAAGTRAALEAAELGSKVILTNKGPLARSGITLTAGGGLQAPFHPDDSPEQFFADVVHHGHLLADQNLAWALAGDARQRVLDLERYGVRFRKKDDGTFMLNQFPGFSLPRNVLFPAGGFGMMNPLKRSCLANEGITVAEDFAVTGLVISNDAAAARSIAGAVGIDLKTGELVTIRAKATVVATGGCQWLWEVTDCPADATGDGLALAYRAGAELVDMEMVLFYPSVIVWPPAARGAFVHYEFLDPAILDGRILDREGNDVLPKPAPVRDQAMRLMHEAIAAGRGNEHGGLWWYLGDSAKGPDHVRAILNTPQYNYIKRQGVDPTSEKVAVAPGAHSQLGGIDIDEDCRTNLPGLYAAPECAGNFEGANRLSGSALAGTQVFSARAGAAAHAWAKDVGQPALDPVELARERDRVSRRLAGPGERANGEAVVEMRRELRRAVQQDLAVKREPAGLDRLIRRAGAMATELAAVKVPDAGVFDQTLLELLELDAMLEVAALVAGSALLRTESRGHHFRADHPARDDVNWLKHTTVSRRDGEPAFGTRPVVATRIPLPADGEAGGGG